jgi:hypothetical protein
MVSRTLIFTASGAIPIALRRIPLPEFPFRLWCALFSYVMIRSIALRPAAGAGDF